MSLLTVFEVAKMLKVTPRTVRRWWYRGIIPQPIKIRGALRWRESDIITWLLDYPGQQH